MIPWWCWKHFPVHGERDAPREAAEKGGMEVALAVLRRLQRVHVFFPVTFFLG